MDDLLACSWLWLHRQEGMGQSMLARLQGSSAPLTSQEALLRAIDRLLYLPRISVDLRERLRRFLRAPQQAIGFAEIEDQWRQLSDRGVQLLPLSDPRYPPALAAIPDPPGLLYLQGRAALLHDPQIAMVGSRRASGAGLRDASELAADLARVGLVVTSGLAAGIDGAAHHGALSVGGDTVAVLGTGIDRVYPARHRALAEQIAATGLLVSEQYPGEAPRPANFPRRNRIISGLSLGVLVVEANQRSGSLITARMALEQGRELFAVPGGRGNPNRQGCHHLIRQGAILVEQVEQILEELQPQLQALLPVPASASNRAPELAAPASVPPLMDLFGDAPIDFDSLLALSGLTQASLLQQLGELELEGWIERCDGRYLRLQYSAAPG